MSKEYQEIWDFLSQFKYSEEDITSLYDTLTKEGFYSVQKLQESVFSEDDLKQIGITQFEKRRALFSVLKKSLDDDEGPSNIDEKDVITSQPVLTMKFNDKSAGEIKHSNSFSEIMSSKKDNKETMEKLKKIGSKIGRGAISRLFYALALVKKRMIEFGLEGSIEAELEVAMFCYNIEIELNNEDNTVEDEISYLKEIESSSEQTTEGEEKEKVKSKEAKFSFIKNAIAKFLLAFREHISVMASKMNKRNMQGTIGIGVGLGLGPLGSISIKPKIDIKCLVEWNKKQKDLESKRSLGNLVIRLISAKELKKGSASVTFLIGDDKRESTTIKFHDPKWDETFDPLPCAAQGDELSIQIYHKNKNIGKKLMDEVFINIEKMAFEDGVPKPMNLNLVSGGSMQLELTFNKIGSSEFQGVLKIEAVEGKKLAKKDITGKSDPYLIFVPGKIKANKISLSAKNVKTKYINQNLNPVWNETLFVKLPKYKEGITIFCYDYDTTGTHDYMGKVFVPLEDIKPNEIYDKWFDLDPEGKIHIKYQFTPN